MGVCVPRLGKRLMGNDNGAELDCTTSLKYNYKLPLPHGVLASLYVKKGKQYLARVEYFILLDLDTKMAAAVRKGYIQAFGKEP